MVEGHPSVRRLKMVISILDLDISISAKPVNRTTAVQPTKEKHMTHKQSEKAQSVPVVEADVLDEMNETNSLIAQRAYEIYQDREGSRSSGHEDWFSAEQELLPELQVDYELSDSAVRLTTRALGFLAKDLEVVVGHRRAVICGVHTGFRLATGKSKDKRILRIVELPFVVDPVTARATLYNGTLQVELSRLTVADPSPLSESAGL
jgi:HSP20 family molecular chaperone IbpA